jgi:hypothetical protein
VRTADRLADVSHERLTVRGGSACDPELLEWVTPGHDTIISTLGPRWPTRVAARVYPESGAAITLAAWASGVQRVLVTSSALLFPTTAWTTLALRRVVRPIVDAAEKLEGHIRQSRTRWTIVRTGFLTNESTTERRVGVEALPDNPAAVSRAAVAELLLEELHTGGHPCSVVGVCC